MIAANVSVFYDFVRDESVFFEDAASAVDLTGLGTELLS
jgi:hypothetical protein